MPYKLICSPSSKVSGSCLPLVSGRARADNAAMKVIDPYMTRGRGAQYLLSMRMRGDTIVAILANIEQVPMATPLL